MNIQQQTATDDVEFLSYLFEEIAKNSANSGGKMTTQDEREQGREKWKRRGILFATGLLGVACMYLSQYLPWEILKEITKEVGVAFLIAATIGATIDSVLKFELLRDAFFAAFRYAFHPALQSEILRIMRYHLICEKHFFHVKLEKIDDETVRVTCETKRTIRNIGSSAAPINPYLHIDEWGFKQESSKILYCKAEFEGGKVITAAEQKVSDPTILFRGKDTNLAPKKTVTITSKWSEVRRNNDSTYINFSYPTIDPEIDVPSVPDFKITRSFGSASSEIEEVLPGRQILRGTYLPFHYMVIRW